MRRRKFIKSAGVGLASIALAGCTGDSDGSTGTNTDEKTETAGTEQPLSGTLNVATYGSFTGEGTAGNWL
ncbi:MAG: thiamine ABC transporter substrate-binding protein, partial [Halobacteriales archaeon]